MKKRGVIAWLVVVVAIAAACGADTQMEDTGPADNARPVELVQEVVEPQRTGYELTAVERDLVERVVMGEAGGEEYIGQQAVAQCILNACYITGNRPAAVIESLQYTSNRPEATKSVIDAVSSVFDDGVKVIKETAMYFYCPALVYSEWHETQQYICTIGCHRFFERRSG